MTNNLLIYDGDKELYVTNYVANDSDFTSLCSCSLLFCFLFVCFFFCFFFFFFFFFGGGGGGIGSNDNLGMHNSKPESLSPSIGYHYNIMVFSSFSSSLLFLSLLGLIPIFLLLTHYSPPSHGLAPGTLLNSPPHLHDCCCCRRRCFSYHYQQQQHYRRQCRYHRRRGHYHHYHHHQYVIVAL